MPLPAAAPLIPAAGAFCAGAAKHLVLHAAPFMDVTTLSSATLAAWLLRYFWKHKVPTWAKEDVSFRNLLRRKHPVSSTTTAAGTTTTTTKKDLTSSEREEREMANLSSVLEKLQALIDSVQLEDDHPSMLQRHAALLAFVQLSAQLKKQEQQQQPQPQQLHDPSNDHNNMMKGEEKKDDNTPPLASNIDDDDDTSSKWTSRDALYESARPSSATLPHIPPDYFEFASNPHQRQSSSPLHTTLQQALTFATWAYYEDSEILADKLAHADFELLEHSRASRPGHVAYYMAVSSVSRHQLVIGLRGTSTLEDIVTDCCGRPVALDDRPYYYDHDRGSKWNRSSNTHESSRIEVKAASPLQVVVPQHSMGGGGGDDDENVVEVISGHERIWVEQSSDASTSSGTSGGAADGDPNHHGDYNNMVDHHLPKCHEGIMLSAKRLVDKIQEQIEHWCVQRGYQLVLCGHSLGAGCASLAAVLLRSRLPELTHTTLIEEGGGRPRPRMQVYCFAPPPVLDKEAALAASSYCTSVVNNADMIPRCSLENLLIFLELLKGIWNELLKQGLAPTGAKTTAAFFRKMAQGTEGELLLPAPAVRNLMRKAKHKIQSNPSKSLGEFQQGTSGHQHDATMETGECDGASPAPSSPAAAEGGAVQLQDSKGRRINPTPLYIPGVVLLAYEPWRGSTSGRDESKSQTGETDMTGSVDIVDMAPTIRDLQSMSWRVTDGTTDALNFLEMDASSRMAMDHATTSYYTLLGMEYEF